jgi:hypothetical protein
MRPAEDIKRLIENLSDKTSARMDLRVRQDMLHALEESGKPSTLTQSNTRRIIVKNSITKLTAAAVIIALVIIGVYQFGTNGSAIAWGNVTARIAKVDFVHFYELRCDQEGLVAVCEGWHAHGKTMRLNTFGNTSYDDGQMEQGFDKHKVRTGKRRSDLADGRTFFEVMSKDLLSTDNDQFNQQKPVNVGGDFLVYRFEPQEEQRSWLKGTSVTVGRNSLLPIQIKTHYDAFYGKGYELVIFDYEETQKPAEFFEPPTASEAPHGKSRIVLDGEEVTMEIKGAPGIKEAVVRLYDKYNGPSDGLPAYWRERYAADGGTVYKLDVTFITEEGYRSKTNDKIILWPNEGMKCGVGDYNWPDGKYRNIVFTPVLRPTDKDNTFTVEINCWLRTKE